VENHDGAEVGPTGPRAGHQTEMATVLCGRVTPSSCPDYTLAISPALPDATEQRDADAQSCQHRGVRHSRHRAVSGPRQRALTAHAGGGR
jgi:hypothetical protein